MTLIVERDGPVAIVTLNRPAAMNALSLELRAGLRRAFAALDDDGDIRVIILTGAGERAFCAGLDLRELGSDPAALSLTKDGDPVGAVSHCSKPVIGAINGVAITGGFELALACDLMIASDLARFADTHARVGVMPGWGLSQKLSRVIGIYRARHLAFTGTFIDAATALAWGLVSEVIDKGKLMARARDIAAEIASIDPSMIRQYKALINAGYQANLGSALDLEIQVSNAINKAVPTSEIEGRRASVMERGRGQAPSQAAPV